MIEKPKVKLQALTIMSYVMVVSGILLILYVAYLFFWPITPVVIKSVQVTTPTVLAGGTMDYKISACKYTQDTPTVYKKIVSATSAQSLPVTQGVVSLGCSTLTVPIHIMEGTPPGKYTLYTEIVYNVNALRIIKVYWHAGPFEVIQ